jgi:hypothetical protein
MEVEWGYFHIFLKNKLLPRGVKIRGGQKVHCQGGGGEGG